MFKKTKPSLLIFSGWAHGIDAIQPMENMLIEQFDVQLLTGAQVLASRHLPETDYIVTGSMGGLLALELLPKSCKKLVLISSTAKFCTGGGYDCGTPERILKRMILQLKRNPNAVLQDFFRNVHYPNKYHTSGSVIEPLDSLVSGLEYLLRSDVREKVPSIGIPVLLMHGTADRIIPPSAAEWLHAHLPNSRLKLFENDGHALPAHRLDEVVDEILYFLQRR